LPPPTTASGGHNTDVKKIKLYRNGDENFYGKEMVFNRRQMRSIDQFLQTVTDHVEMDRAARSIHTPLHGHKIDNVDEISDKGEYVVVANGKFKKMEYVSLPYL
jgi:hypothetical protein